MAALPLLPDTAPFAADQISALNTVMAGTSAEQRTWLSGFLAGFQAATAPPPATAGAPPARKLPLTILFATESGNAEALADARPQGGGEAGLRAARAGHGGCHAGTAGQRWRTCW